VLEDLSNNPKINLQCDQMSCLIKMGGKSKASLLGYQYSKKFRGQREDQNEANYGIKCLCMFAIMYLILLFLANKLTDVLKHCVTRLGILFGSSVRKKN
jgi:hypothetical protein